MNTITKTAVEKTYPYGDAIQAAHELMARLGPTVRRVELAGSLRRRKVRVHDIDLVVWAVYQDYESSNLFGEKQTVTTPPVALIAALHPLEDTSPGNPVNLDPKILKSEWGGIPVEIYLCERDGSNFEALWQMRTGSAGYNRWLASRAQASGLTYKAGYGIFRGAQRIDDGTEKGIWKALGLVWTEPEKRE